MQTCIVRPLVKKPVNYLKIKEFTKLSEALPGTKILLILDVVLKKIYPGTLLGIGKIGFLKKKYNQKKYNTFINWFWINSNSAKKLRERAKHKNIR